MRILAIETASEACSVALFNGPDLIAHDYRNLGRGHAEQLVPMIAGLPDKGFAERILVSLGPGSFTGVRIGLATARALGVAWRAEVLGYPTLSLIAAMAQAEFESAPVTICTNGGHGEWFMQSFGKNGLPETEVISRTPDKAVQSVLHPICAGNRAGPLLELVGTAQNAIDLLPDAAAALLVPPALLTSTLTPIYGRAPDATPQKLPAAK